MFMLQCLILSFLLLCLLYHQHQLVSKTELLCACYGVWFFLFFFSVYSIINISRWVKLNYCVHVTVFDYFFSVSLSTLSSTSAGEQNWIIVFMLRCLIISFLLFLLYHQHQDVSKIELLCACLTLRYNFPFSFSIINIMQWVWNSL